MPQMKGLVKKKLGRSRLGSQTLYSSNSNGKSFAMEKLIRSKGLPLSLTHSFGKWTGWWLHRAGGQWRSVSFWKSGQMVSTNGYLWTQVSSFSRLGALSASFGHLTQTATLPLHSSLWPLAPLCGTCAQREQAPTTRVAPVAAEPRPLLLFPHFACCIFFND